MNLNHHHSDSNLNAVPVPTDTESVFGGETAGWPCKLDGKVLPPKSEQMVFHDTGLEGSVVSGKAEAGEIFCQDGPTMENVTVLPRDSSKIGERRFIPDEFPASQEGPADPKEVFASSRD